MNAHPEPATTTPHIGASGPIGDSQPTAGRRMVPVADLTAHPGNVRQELSSSPSASTCPNRPTSSSRPRSPSTPPRC